MTLPRHLVIVRHGESEGNAANARSRTGDDSAFDAAFRARHSAWWRLTDAGRAQAAAAGEWMRDNLHESGAPIVFDRYSVSTYARAMETAALLSLPEAAWMINPDLRERNWGDLDLLPKSEQRAIARAHDGLRPTAPFYWRPPNGESIAEVSVRLRSVLDGLHRESLSGALMVCHGEVMSAFHRLLTRITDEEFARRVSSEHPEDRIHNCSVHWYTRIDPVTGAIAPAMSHWRSVCAPDPEVADTGWVAIDRRLYSNEDLLSMVGRHERLLS